MAELELRVDALLAPPAGRGKESLGSQRGRLVAARTEVVQLAEAIGMLTDSRRRVEQEARLAGLKRRLAALALATRSATREQAAADARGERASLLSTTTQAHPSSTADTTVALTAAVRMMQAEVDRSNEFNAVLAASTVTLASTSTSYSTLLSHLRSSRALVSALSQQDLLDRLILAAGLVVFLAAVAYVFYRRVPTFGLEYIVLALWTGAGFVWSSLGWMLSFFSSSASFSPSSSLETANSFISTHSSALSSAPSATTLLPVSEISPALKDSGPSSSHKLLHSTVPKKPKVLPKSKSSKDEL